MDRELIKEINQKEKTALIIWDVQKALVEGIFNKEEFLENTKKLIEAAHKNNIPVIFTAITPLPERFESAPRKMMMKIRKMKINWTPEGMQQAITPGKEDIILPKNTASIFIGTNFESMMRNARITTFVFAGIATEYGVESSARDASNRGFFSVIAKDAVSSFNKESHERSLKNMESMFALMTADEILQMWG